MGLFLQENVARTAFAVFHWALSPHGQPLSVQQQTNILALLHAKVQYYHVTAFLLTSSFSLMRQMSAKCSFSP